MEQKLSRIEKIEIALGRIKQSIPEKYSDIVECFDSYYTKKYNSEDVKLMTDSLELCIFSSNEKEEKSFFSNLLLLISNNPQFCESFLSIAESAQNLKDIDLSLLTFKNDFLNLIQKNIVSADFLPTKIYFEKNNRIAERLLEIGKLVSLRKKETSESLRRNLAVIAIKDPRTAHLLMTYRRLLESKNDTNYPLNPYYYDLENQTQESINAFSKKILTQWHEQRKIRYRNSKNVVYDREDYFSQYLFAPKYPVIANSSLANFLDNLEDLIRKSDPNENSQFENLTHVEPVFSQDKNGNIVRFIKILEIAPAEYLRGTTKCKSFDFSVSIKFMPDDNLNHSTCLFRFDSRISGHKNIKIYENIQNYNFIYGNQKQNSAHFHFFDFFNTFTYLGMPLSANSISIDSLAMFTSTETPIPQHITPLVEHLEEFKKARIELDLSRTQLSEIAETNKKSWYTKLGALRKVLKLLDKCYSIYPEKDIEYVKSMIKGDIYKIVVQPETMTEQISKKRNFRKYDQTKPINPVRGNGHGNELARKSALIQKRNLIIAK